jgi:hypothetical protein
MIVTESELAGETAAVLASGYTLSDAALEFLVKSTLYYLLGNG